MEGMNCAVWSLGPWAVGLMNLLDNGTWTTGSWIIRPCTIGSWTIEQLGCWTAELLDHGQLDLDVGLLGLAQMASWTACPWTIRPCTIGLLDHCIMDNYTSTLDHCIWIQPTTGLPYILPPPDQINLWTLVKKKKKRKRKRRKSITS